MRRTFVRRIEDRLALLPLHQNHLAKSCDLRGRWHCGLRSFGENIFIVVFCARSSVGLERLTTDQEAGGSSPPGRAFGVLRGLGA